MDRLQWYFLEEVTQADMNSADDKRENAINAVVQDILGKGFLITGLNPCTVVQNPGTPDLRVRANQFLGYDQSGRRLSNVRSGYQGGVNQGATPQLVNMATDELGVPTAVSTSGKEKTLAIFIQFRRNPSDQRTDGNSATIYFVEDESIQFNVVQSAEANVGLSVPPPLRSDQILLADVVLTFGQTQILNASISQARRQSFQLVLPHGSSHVSTGSDPIPGATSLVGGLFMPSDKTKLDGITTPYDAWIGGQLPYQADLYQPANLGPATFGLTTDVTTKMTGQSAGGSSIKEAVATQSAGSNARADLRTTADDSFLDAAGNEVYGLLSVDNETTPTAWTLTFYSDVGGVATAYDFTALGSITIKWYVRKTYRLDHLPTFSKFEVPSDQVAGTIPDATTAIKGKVLLAPDGGTTPGTVVQGNDSRLASIGSGNLPIGSVVAWMAPTVGTPLPAAPSGFEYCDGGTVSTAGPLFGKTKPPLMKTAGQPGTPLRYIRGHDGTAGNYGGGTLLLTGGADSHSHTVNAHNHGGSASFGPVSTDTQGAHTHSVPDADSVGGTGAGAPAHTVGFNPSGGHGVGLAEFTGFTTLYTHTHSVPATGSGGAHAHSVSGSVSIGSDAPGTNAQNNLPAYVAMAYIIRVA